MYVCIYRAAGSYSTLGPLRLLKGARTTVPCVEMAGTSYAATARTVS